MKTCSKSLFFCWLLVMCQISTISSGLAETEAPLSDRDDFFDMSLEELVNIKITTASRISEAISDAPATVHVVTKQDIRKRGYATLADVLRDVPGMETIPIYFSEVGTLVPVRGVVGNNKIIVLVNGVRVNPPGGEEMMLRDDVSVRMAEQIEIILGPGSTLYGADAISAVINIITQKPQHQESAQVLGGLGNFNQKEAFTGFSEGMDLPEGRRLGLSGYVHFLESDLSKLDEEYPEWWSNYEAVASKTGLGADPQRWSRGLNAMLRAETGSNSLQFWYRDSSRSSSEGGLTPTLQYVDEAKWKDESLVIEGKNVTKLSDKVDLESALTYNRYEIDPNTRYVWPESENELSFNDFKYGIGTSAGIEERLRYQATKSLTILAGASATEYDVIPKATVPGGADTDESIVPQAGSISYFTQPGDPDSLVEVARATNLRYQDYGLFTEGHWNITDRWKVTAGGRMDFSTRYNQTPFSPRTALIYHDAASGFTGKYIFTKAFVAPAPYFGHNVFDNGVAINTANPDLQPEEAISNEITFTWTKKNWLFGSSFFYNEQDNLLLVGDLALDANILQNEVWVDPEGRMSRLLTQSVNGGESEALGSEFWLRYQRDRISAWASYSYVDFESTIDGIKSGLPGISQHNVRAGISIDLLDNLTLTPSLVYRSTPRNISNTFGLGEEIKDPYALNLYLLYTPAEKVDLFVNIENLTDHHYALKGLAGPTPQEPLTAKAGVRVRF